MQSHIKEVNANVLKLFVLIACHFRTVCPISLLVLNLWRFEPVVPNEQILYMFRANSCNLFLITTVFWNLHSFHYRLLRNDCCSVSFLFHSRWHLMRRPELGNEGRNENEYIIKFSSEPIKNANSCYSVSCSYLSFRLFLVRCPITSWFISWVEAEWSLAFLTATISHNPLS